MALDLPAGRHEFRFIVEARSDPASHVCRRRERSRNAASSWLIETAAASQPEIPGATESAGVTLVKGDVRAITRARRLSGREMTNIKRNRFFAYNAAGVPIAAGVLYAFSGLLLSPIIAAATMSFSSVSVTGDALRLRSFDV